MSQVGMQAQISNEKGLADASYLFRLSLANKARMSEQKLGLKRCRLLQDELALPCCAYAVSRCMALYIFSTISLMAHLAWWHIFERSCIDSHSSDRLQRAAFSSMAIIITSCP